MKTWHRPRIQALVEAGVDLLALETIPCQEEAEMLCDLLREFPEMKAWLVFNCKVSVQHKRAFKCPESITSNLLKSK